MHIPLLPPPPLRVLKLLLLLVLELTIGDKVFCTNSTGLPFPAKVVGHIEGYVELEHHQHDAPWTPSPLVSPVLTHPRHLRKSLPTSLVMRGDGGPLQAEVVEKWRTVQGLPLKSTGFALWMYASSLSGGFQGGHVKASLLLGAARVLCVRCAKTPPSAGAVPVVCQKKWLMFG